MYQVSNSFLQAMDDISRTLAVEVEISGVRYPTDAIIRFELERGVFDNDTFTIGQTMSNALTLEIFTTPTIQTGDELKLFTSLRVGEKDERVPLGVYYVDSTAINKEKMTLTCYDKMVTLIDEYIPSANHTTLAALFEDVLSQIGMTYDGVFHDVPIKAPLHGYTYRETLGFIASLNGGNMVVNRAGHLEIQRFQTVERSIPAKACFSFEVKEPYRVSKVFCQFGDVGITRGDSSGQCVAFENPYVTEQNIDTIYNLLNGLSFTAASLNYRGDLTLDPGDIFQFTDYKGDIYPLMCGRNKLTFNGGLSGQLDSIGESETTNSYAESQLKYKKNITKLTAELGKIQGVVQEIEQSHDGLEERVKNAELEMTADAIKSKVENHFVAKDEINGLVTEEQLQSAITQSADSISAQVSTKYETKANVETMVNSLTTRMTNAESKITDEAITNTVKQSFYTKEETNNAITSKGYATQSQLQQTANNITSTVSQNYYTKQETENAITSQDYQTSSQVQQTVNNLEIKFTESGGYNMLKNGSFMNGISIWGIKNAATTENDTSCPYGTEKSRLIYSTNTWSGIYQDITFVVGKTYSWSAHVKVEKGSVYVGVEGISAKTISGYTASWQTVSGTFVATKTSHRFVVTNTTETSATIRAHGCMVCYGQLPQQYTPHPSEIYDGITTIDKDGIKVVHGDSYSRLGAHGLMRYDGNVGKYYHYLSYMGQVDLASEERATIQLPPEFRNRDFKVIVSVKRVRMNYDPYAEKHLLMGFYAEVNSVNTANATFEVYASVRAIKSTNFNGSLTGADYGHDIVRPVVAYWVYA